MHSAGFDSLTRGRASPYCHHWIVTPVQVLNEKHAVQLTEVEGHMDAERKALRQAASAAAATAAANAEERAQATSHSRFAIVTPVDQYMRPLLHGINNGTDTL